jgi:hypothetical protein
MVQHVSTATDVVGTGYWANAVAGNPYNINLPNQTGGGNCLILALSCPYSASRTITVSDDQSNTWQLAVSTHNASVISSIYIATNVYANTQKVTVTFDTGLYGCQFVLSEFYNVAAGAAIDTTAASHASAAPSVNGGSMTTVSGGDLIYNYAYDQANSSLAAGSGVSVSSITGGTGFSLLSADVFIGDFAQYYVQPSAGAITPSATVSGVTDTFNSVAVALKASSGQGTAPSPTAIRIVRVCHFMVNSSTPIQFPCVGNLILFATARPESKIDYSAVTSKPSNNWTKIDESLVNGTGPPQVWYATNATPSLNMNLNVTGTPGPFGTTLVFYDVVNAGAYDTGAGRPSSYLVTSSPTQSFSNFCPITPSQPGELIFDFLQCSFGPVVVVSPGTMDTVMYGGQIDADLMDNADGYAHYYSNSTSTTSFSYTMNSGGQDRSQEVGIAIAFSAASPTPTPNPTPPGLLSVRRQAFSAPGAASHNNRGNLVGP